MEDFKTTTKTIRVMYRCKRCKITIRRTFEQKKETFFYTAHLPNGMTLQKSKVSSVDYFDGAQRVGHNFIPSENCPKCKRYMDSAPIEGHLVETVACNAKCTTAVGHVCDCSCGGENHGAAHDAKQYVA